jgi:hypothetical protein
MVAYAAGAGYFCNMRIWNGDGSTAIEDQADSPTSDSDMHVILQAVDTTTGTGRVTITEPPGITAVCMASYVLYSDMELL